jgi:hypothetical protein
MTTPENEKLFTYDCRGNKMRFSQVKHSHSQIVFDIKIDHQDIVFTIYQIKSIEPVSNCISEAILL